MGVIHGNLCEIRICRAAEGVWKDEMEKNALSRHQAFSFMNGGRVASRGDRRAGNEVKDRKGVRRVSREGGGRGGRKTSEKFFQEIASSTCTSLFTVARKNLKTKS